jgi:hypothetical protein
MVQAAAISERPQQTGNYRHPADRPAVTAKPTDMPRIKRAVRLKSGPHAVAEKLAAAQASQRAAGHPPPFKLPSGAAILACGPVITKGQASTTPAAGQPQQPNLTQ